jgi:hypothetical protein
MKDIAEGRTEITSIILNALTGMLLVLAAALTTAGLFSPGLILAGTILFGPLLGFAVSSTYARIEWTVGRRMGGDASHELLYRIFACSFLPAGIAAVLYIVTLFFIKDPGLVAYTVAGLLPIALIILSARAYCAGIIAAQRFNGLRGIACLVTTCLLFGVLIFGWGVLLILLYKYTLNESLRIF